MIDPDAVPVNLEMIIFILFSTNTVSEELDFFQMKKTDELAIRRLQQQTHQFNHQSQKTKFSKNV